MGTNILNRDVIFAEEAANKAGVFTTSNYGELTYPESLPNDDIEIEFDFTMTADTAINDIFNYTSIGATGAIRILYVPGTISIKIALASNTDSQDISFTLEIGTKYVFKFIKRTGQVSEFFIDTVQYGTFIRTGVLNITDDVILIGAIISNTTRFFRGNSLFSSFSLNDIVTEDELIKLDWNNGDANTVPNIGADAPVSSDMIWVPAGSGTYVDL